MGFFSAFMDKAGTPEEKPKRDKKSVIATKRVSSFVLKQHKLRHNQKYCKNKDGIMTYQSGT